VVSQREPLLEALQSFEALTQQLQDGLSEHHRQTQASSEALDTSITQLKASVQQMELVPEQASQVLADRTTSLIDLLTTSLIENDDALAEIASKVGRVH
jgi:predicted GTPase